MIQCLICLDERPYMTVGNCDHMVTCLDCTYKQRIVSQNKRCTMCNQDLPTVLVFNQTEPPPSGPPDPSAIREFKGGIQYIDNASRIECLKLENKTCFIGKCNANFQTIQQFYLHLKMAHGRYMCDLCVTNRALLLKEQPIYRKEEYDKHLHFGDFDEENNLINMHPFCTFCQNSYFNDDVFYDHLRKSHFNCSLCDPKTTKYVFYKDSNNLREHYKLAHYPCPHPDCQLMVAYKSRIDLDAHTNREHNRGKQVKITLSGVGDDKDDKLQGKIDEKNGHDFTNSVI